LFSNILQSGRSLSQNDVKKNRAGNSALFPLNALGHAPLLTHGLRAPFAMLFRSPPPPPPPPFASHVTPRAATDPRPVILVVDDSAMIRGAVTKLLAQHHYEIRQAENGRLGLAAWEQSRDNIQLVLSDVFMPEMDGLSMAQAIRRQSKSIPILLMSSKLDDNSRWIAEEAGFRLLPKPFKDEVLLMVVDRLIRTPRPA
jgi:CheY-like chemotaxis protein